MKAVEGCALIESPVGRLLLAAREDGLTHLLFADNAGRPIGRRESPRSDTSRRARAILEDARCQLAEYFGGKRRDFDLPVRPEGTVFQTEVWNALRSIPYGETTSYGELARRIGREKAVRAVGAANGANPVSIILPCHRVVGSSGTLTGYGGGLDAKRLLLELEGAKL